MDDVVLPPFRIQHELGGAAVVVCRGRTIDDVLSADRTLLRQILLESAYFCPGLAKSNLFLEGETFDLPGAL